MKVGFYPGSFKPMHAGHYGSMLDAASQVDKLFVLVSTKDRVRKGEKPFSGAACVEYIQKYIVPSLDRTNIKIIFVDDSPVVETYKQLERLQDKQNLEFYLFAGQEDIPKRFSEKSLMKSVPELQLSGRVHVVPLKLVMQPDGKQRISGNAVRSYIDNGDMANLAINLPNIPEVQNNLRQIINLLKQGVNSMETLQEMIMLLVKEVLLEKRAKGKFPKKYEGLIMKLKDRYGDPTTMEPGPEKAKAGALVFGTVQNIMKRKKSKKKASE